MVWLMAAGRGSVVSSLSLKLGRSRVERGERVGRDSLEPSRECEEAVEAGGVR